MFQELDSLLERVICKAEEKVATATKAFDFVDKQIRHLDDDLIKFDSDFQLSDAEFAQLKKHVSMQASTTQQQPSSQVKSTQNSTNNKQQPSTTLSSESSATVVVKRNGRPPRKAADKTLKKLGQVNSASGSNQNYDNQNENDFESFEPSEDQSNIFASQSSLKSSLLPNSVGNSSFYSNQSLPSIEMLAELPLSGNPQTPHPFYSSSNYSMPHSNEHFPHGMMSVDPNEPKYCYCNQVSYGEMIACDNENCEIEWFHYDCVGLKMPPKGKWYCNECVQKKRKGLIK